MNDLAAQSSSLANHAKDAFAGVALAIEGLEADASRARQEYREALNVIREAAADPMALDVLRGKSIDQLNQLIARRLSLAAGTKGPQP